MLHAAVTKLSRKDLRIDTEHLHHPLYSLLSSLRWREKWLLLDSALSVLSLLLFRCFVFIPLYIFLRVADLTGERIILELPPLDNLVFIPVMASSHTADSRTTPETFLPFVTLKHVTRSFQFPKHI